MWLLTWLPNWLFYATFFIGLFGTIAVSVIKTIPYNLPLKAAFVVILFFSTYMIGVISDNDAWLKKVAELETKVAKAETESAQTNTKIVEKLVTRTQLIRERGQDITNYVDREVVKYDSGCVIPQEFIQAHNRAAEVPK
jgi:hypothetical protein